MDTFVTNIKPVIDKILGNHFEQKTCISGWLNALIIMTSFNYLAETFSGSRE